MKLIIDIPENVIEDAKSSPNYYPIYYFVKIWKAIANGIPYEERPQGEWIPVSERLPEEHGYYLVTTDGSHNAVIDIAEYGKFFRKPENEYVLEWNKASRVIAWQPLPEAYKEGGEA